jgi:probable phosphoglycerate mutase
MLARNQFYFLRHGETEWNRLHLMQGQTDTPLNPHGIVQTEAAATVLMKRKVTAICTSPLRRARHTAELISARINVPMLVIKDLGECAFGAYEGHPAGPWRDAWFAGAEIPGAERFEDFLDRSLHGLNAALAYGGRPLIVAHGGTFWAVRRYALGGDMVRAANCELFALSPPRSETARKWRIKRLFVPEDNPAAAERPAMAM